MNLDVHTFLSKHNYYIITELISKIIKSIHNTPELARDTYSQEI